MELDVTIRVIESGDSATFVCPKDKCGWFFKAIHRRDRKEYGQGIINVLWHVEDEHHGQ